MSEGPTAPGEAAFDEEALEAARILFAHPVHFMMGALSHTMCGSPEFLQILGLNSGFDDRMDRLKRFLTAGLQAGAESEEGKQ